MRVLNHQAITDLLFWPRAFPTLNSFRVECEGATLVCSFSQEAANKNTIAFFHGNGETVGEYAGLLPEIFSAIGCNTFLVEYRGYGMSSGCPGLGHLLADAETVISAIPVHKSTLIIFGRSFGCIPAMHVVAKFPEIHNLILESPISDLFDYVTRKYEYRLFMDATYRENSLKFEQINWRLFNQRCKAQFSFNKMLARFRGKSLVTHAEGDTNIPSASAATIYKWLPEPKIMKDFKHGDHNSIFLRNVDEYCESILDMISLEL